MSNDLEIVRKKDYLHIVISGVFSLATARQSIDALTEVCGKEGCGKALFDIRTMTGEMRVFDRFRIGQYGSEVLPHHIRVAMLARKDQVSPDNFFENVAVNRGMVLRVFTKPREAVSWLKK